MNIETEQQIIEVAKVDPLAFGKLFDYYYQPIFGYVLKRVSDPSLAQDITAETFLKAFQNIKYFKWQDVSISSWFYKIATNEIRTYFRKNKYTPKSLEQLFEADGFEPVSDQDIPQEMIDAQNYMERQIQFQRAQRLLLQMPMKYQEVLTLRFVEKKKLSEIAMILGKKEGTVKSLVSRGLTKLRDLLYEPETQPNPISGVIASEGQILIKTQESYEE